ncbi:MAG TPA: hypothetical protein PLS49_04920 [Candidatus Woesebacteria bacterium]|nr:hypothetical protein [Candidatus Woesebacteria bacterium]
MPELSSTKTDYDLDALPPSTLAAFDSVQLLAKTLNDAYFEPIRIFSESLNQVYLEPMRQLGKTFEAYNTQIAKVIATAVTIDRNLWKNTFTPPTINASSIFGDINVIDSEVEEVSSVQSIPASLPAVRTQYLKVYEDFNMAISIEGRFYFNGMILNNLSTNSRHGQFLKFLLENEANYVTDEFLLAIFNPPDPDKGIGYIRDDLKRNLAKEGIRIDIYRNRDITNKGYKLIKIAKLSN